MKGPKSYRANEKLAILVIGGERLLPTSRHGSRCQINAHQSLTQHVLLLPLELAAPQPGELPAAGNEAGANECGREAVVLRFNECDCDIVLGERVGVEAAFVKRSELGRLRRGTAE